MVIVDRVTCKCDGDCRHCDGAGCIDCKHSGARTCELPCFLRVGLTDRPCCPDCGPVT